MTKLAMPSTVQVAHFGNCFLDFQRMELCCSGQVVELTLRQFRVLKLLVMRPGIVLSRQKLIASAWPKRQRSTYRTVDNCIAKLRQKIENNPECPVLIRTVHGIGYKFVPLERLEPAQENIANEGIS
jgi:DNA-binding response OmpR family regulator